MNARPHDNCYWVLPGRLMAGEYPGAPDRKVARQRLGDITGTGVRYFIDLTDPHELKPYLPQLQELARGDKVVAGYERWPIRDMDVPHSAGYANQILDRLDALVEGGAVPYLHCWGGVGRTGTIIGCWLVRHGETGAAALERIAGHWETVAKRDRHPRSPETEAQRKFVLDWASSDRLRSATPPR
jgi:hypothetical protein